MSTLHSGGVVGFEYGFRLLRNQFPGKGHLQNLKSVPSDKLLTSLTPYSSLVKQG